MTVEITGGGRVKCIALDTDMIDDHFGMVVVHLSVYIEFVDGSEDSAPDVVSASVVLSVASIDGSPRKVIAAYGDDDSFDFLRRFPGVLESLQTKMVEG